MLTPVIQRSNISMVLPWLAFATLISILPVAFLYEKGGRVLFYYCGYFSVLGTISEFYMRRNFKLINNKALSLLILGVMFIGWSIIVQISPHTQIEEYYTAGKRCLIGFLIINYIFFLVNSGVINKQYAVRLGILSLSLAFITASLFGIYQGLTTSERVVLGINRATLTAYAYSALTLSLIAIILNFEDTVQKKLYFILVAVVSLYVIMLTQTRAAMVIHTLFLIYMAFRLFALTRNVKLIGSIALMMFIAIGVSYKLIEKRVERTIVEYDNYQKGNDKTSLGSRFTMWKTGILAFEQEPFGQTQYNRNKFIKNYLYTHHQRDSWALRYIDVHLHNEFIQFSSLFGVSGILALIYFFYVYIYAEIKRSHTLTPLAVTGLTILLYGMTDVILTSVEFIAMFSVMAVLLSLIQGEA